jgi:hypothetical protein
MQAVDGKINSPSPTAQNHFRGIRFRLRPEVPYENCENGAVLYLMITAAGANRKGYEEMTDSERMLTTYECADIPAIGE